MQINRFIRLHFKSIQRNNESLYFTIIITVFFVGFAGFKLNESIVQLFSSPSDSSLFFIITCGIFLFNDYILKCLYKRNFIFPSLIKCIPGSNRLYTPYYLLSEATSIWNLYILFLLFCPVFFTMYDLHGIINALMLFAGIFLLTILASNMVFSLNMKRNKLPHIIFHILIPPSILFLFYFSLALSREWLLGSSIILLVIINYYFVISNVRRVKYWNGQDSKIRFLIFRNKTPLFRRHSFFLYTSLHTRMILRSPVLRKQTALLLLLTTFFFISFATKEQLMEDYMISFIPVSLLLMFFPISFISFFSTEAAFYDRLILSPSFRTFLISRYIECVLYSSFFFLIILFVYKENTGIFYMTATFLYCIGFILLLNFPRLFYANHKQDISTTAKSWSSQSGFMYELYTIVVYLVALSFVFLIYYLFSATIATHFMFWTGLISVLFSPLWLKKIHKLYMKRTKYKHLENYRK